MNIFKNHGGNRGWQILHLQSESSDIYGNVVDIFLLFKNGLAGLEMTAVLFLFTVSSMYDLGNGAPTTMTLLRLLVLPIM